MNKERAAQLAEKCAKEAVLKQTENELAEQMERELQRAREMEQGQELKRWEESVNYKQQLEKQLCEQERQKQAQYEEFLKEKLMIDKIVRTIYDEDQREIEARLEKQKATREYIEEFMAKREEWRAHEKKLMEEENERILHFAMQQQEREEERMQAQQVKTLEFADVQNKLSDRIAEDQNARDEMERVRLELYMEEQEETNRQKEMQDMENRIRTKLDLQETMKHELLMKQQKKTAEKEEEEQFRQQVNFQLHKMGQMIRTNPL